MTIANEIKESITRSSWIRKMFNEGNKLKIKYGYDNVYDFSLGNPNLLPPNEFYRYLKDEINIVEKGKHSYMPQTGYPETCNSIAQYISDEQEIDISGNEIIMTCGAAGALNVILKSILNPDDEVLTPMPCFVEYESYVNNHGGILKKVKTKQDFNLDFKAINRIINKKTKAMIINSPNNPTGQVYSAYDMNKLGKLLFEKSNEYGRIIYLISDEPYRKIVFDNIKVPSIFKNYNNSIIVTSYSKDLSIPGERIGFAAINSKASYKDDLISAMAVANRILGFVNAPALMQRIISKLQGLSVDINKYKSKRDLLCDGLSQAGYDFLIPPGTFYLFPKSPIQNDVDFVRALQKELILVVPGSGFDGPGYFRIAFCVDDETIIGSMPGFKRVMESFKK